jgi:citrate lyase synthetase
MFLLQESDQGHDGFRTVDEHNHCLKCDVKVEIVVIADSNAIIDPGAVMVKSFDTVAADGAMSASTRADTFTVRTQLRTVNQVQHLHEVNLFVYEVAWLRAGCNCEKDQAENLKAAI